MKVYISGPVTGTEDYVERFWAAERLLRSKGYDVVNPVDKNAWMADDTPWKTYMGESLRMVCECDAIFMMRNWLQSRGAKLEYTVATHVGLKIMEDADL